VLEARERAGHPPVDGLLSYVRRGLRGGSSCGGKSLWRFPNGLSALRREPAVDKR